MSLPPEEPTGDDRHSLPEKRESGPNPSPAPQKPISVDEMMQQLRSPEGKKRRRRSHQPVYESRRRRRTVAIILISLATLSVGGCFGFRWFQKLRLEGETFRDALNRRLTDELGCVVQLSRIHDGGDSSLSASSGRIDLFEKDLLEFAEFETVSASLTSSSWVSDEWGITKLTIDDAKFRLNPERALIRGDTMFIRATSKGREKSTDTGWRMGISPTPATISLDKIQVARDLTLEWPAAGTEKKVEGISKSRATINLPVTGGLDGHLLKGVLSLRGMPDMSLVEAHWKLNGRALHLEGSNFILDEGTGSSEGGIVSASGDFDLQPKGTAKLTVGMSKVPAGAFFSAFWKDRLSGLTSVKDASFTSSFAEGQERVLEGDFSVEGMLVSNLPFVATLANHLQRPDIAKGMEFPVFTGHFKWSPTKGLELSKLAGERPGEIRIGGSLTATPDGKINGTVSFGVHSALIARIRSLNTAHPFRPAENDWFSTTFQLTGAGSAISDSLPPPGQAGSQTVPSPTPAPAPVPQGNDAEDFNKLIQPK